MLFNSFGYAVFLPIVFILYWIVPGKYRWIILLMSSYYFYASWGPSVCSCHSYYNNYFLYSCFDNGCPSERAKYIERQLLALSIIICTGLLFFL